MVVVKRLIGGRTKNITLACSLAGIADARLSRRRAGVACVVGLSRLCRAAVVHLQSRVRRHCRSPHVRPCACVPCGQAHQILRTTLSFVLTMVVLGVFRVGQLDDFVSFR